MTYRFTKDLPISGHKSGELIQGAVYGKFHHLTVDILLHLGIIEEVRDERWKPKDGDIYWYVGGSLEVNEALFKAFSLFCESHLKANNCFPTKEAAEVKAAQIRKILNE